MKKVYLFFLMCVSIVPLTGCIGIGGEEISLSHEALTTQPQKYNERLTVEKPATDIREEKSRIGRTTFTLFAITTGSVTTTSPVENQIVEEIIDALSLLGYQINKNTNASENITAIANPLTLNVVLNKIWFKNYNWVFPIVPTWGDINVTLFLENSKGKKLFEKSYEGEGSSLCLSGHCAFDSATKEAMTELLNKITSDFISQPVRDVIISNYKSELAQCSVLCQLNQKAFNTLNSKVDNLSSKTKETVKLYCKTEEPVGPDGSAICKSAITMAYHVSDALYSMESIGHINNIDNILLLGDPAIASSIDIGNGYEKVWKDAISDEVDMQNSEFSDHSFNVNYALKVASHIISSTDINKKNNALAKLIQLKAKNNGSTQEKNYSIASHKIINLSLSPKRSLSNYSQELQLARTQWESAKMALSLEN